MNAPESRRHDHDFDTGNPVGERGTRAVLALSLAMMLAELGAGYVFGSMALLADGWHMATHVAAMGIAAGAYFLARRHAADERFAFGTWKIEVLGGFTSAVVLVLVALGMMIESLQRLWQPQAIAYRESLVVAVIGLVVNLVSVWFLHGSTADPETEHGHADDGSCGVTHGHEHHHDVNLRAALLHVIADAATSVLAIAALLGGWWLGWAWLDPTAGIVGGVVIGWWSWGLARGTSRILLDCEMDHAIVQEVRESAAEAAVEICDLHVWRVGRRKYACVVSIVVADHHQSVVFRRHLARHRELAHVTIEVFHRAAGQIADVGGDR